MKRKQRRLLLQYRQDSEKGQGRTGGGRRDCKRKEKREERREMVSPASRQISKGEGRGEEGREKGNRRLRWWERCKVEEKRGGCCSYKTDPTEERGERGRDVREKRRELGAAPIRQIQQRKEGRGGEM